MEMDFNTAFAVLGIEPVKDENLIRSAYCAALPANNPEENPEGFKLLRKAYECAIDYSRAYSTGNVCALADAKEYGEIKDALQRVYMIRNPGSGKRLEMAADRLEKEFIALCESSNKELCADDMRLLVYAYSNQKKPEKAIEAIASKPSYEEEIKGYHMLLSHLYKLKDDYEMAIKHGRLRLRNIKEKLLQLEKTGESCGDDTKESLMQSLSDANLQLGLMLMICTRDAASQEERAALYKEAACFLAASWDAASDNLAARVNLANCYFNLQEYKKACEIYDELTERLGAQNALQFIQICLRN